MSDFIREVDEDYRRERASKFLSRFSIPIAIAVVLVIAGAGGWRLWLDHQVESSSKANVAYDAAGQLMTKGDAKGAQAAFDTLAKDGPGGYRGLALMRAAQAQAATDPEGAAKAFDTLAGDESLGQSMQDAARARGAMIRIDSEDPKAFEQRYGRFSVANFAFHDTMRELLALAALKRQDFDGARKYLNEIIIDPVSPPSLRNRAQAFLALTKAGAATDTNAPAAPATLTPVEPPPSAPSTPPAAALPTPPAPTPAAPPAAAAMPIPPAPIPPAPTAPAPSSPAK